MGATLKTGPLRAPSLAPSWGVAAVRTRAAVGVATWAATGAAVPLRGFSVNALQGSAGAAEVGATVGEARSW
jgi:hypothetical protein